MLNLSKNERGFSMVELMIGLTLGLIIMASLSYLLANNNGARVELDKTMRQVENGRYAMDLLKNELHLAGYYGPSYTAGPTPATVPDPCQIDPASLAALTAALPLAVQGYAGQPSGSPLGCLPAAEQFLWSAPGTGTTNDVLVVRRVLTSSTTVTNVITADQANNQTVQNTYYLQSNGDSFVFNLGSTAVNNVFNLQNALTNGSPLPVPLYQFVEYIYYVSACDVPANNSNYPWCTGAGDDNGKPIPTLKRLELTVDSTGKPTLQNPVALVEGVEGFHVEYGQDTDGDGAADSYGPPPTSAAGWTSVVALRVYLLVRNTQTSPGQVDMKSYQIGMSPIIPVGPMKDGYKRHVFSQTIRLTNVAQRKET